MELRERGKGKENDRGSKYCKLKICEGRGYSDMY
jgi:hypothetical protein